MKFRLGDTVIMLCEVSSKLPVGLQGRLGVVIAVYKGNGHSFPYRVQYRMPVTGEIELINLYESEMELFYPLVEIL